MTAVLNATTMDGVPTGQPARSLYQTEGILYVAYAQAAVYDAVMKISHRYALYHHFESDAEDASMQAAVIAASAHVLSFYLPDQAASVQVKYATSVASLPANEQTANGIAVGLAAAKDIEKMRAHDGRNAAISDACPTTTTPGAWQCPPIGLGVHFEQTPWLAVMKPFLLRKPTQFRAPAPPKITDARWLSDLQEVKDFGAIDSAKRTDDQKAIALFWNFNATRQSNQSLRDTAVLYHLDLVDTVRLLAMGDMVATDAGIACFNSKYHWLFWRPITAIRAMGDPTWKPLVNTPNHPEYPSQHGCVTSALYDVIAYAVGTKHINLTVLGGPVTGTTPVPRHYNTVQDIQTELVNARVWIGFHYRNSVHAGENLGNSVAAWTLKRFFLPTEDFGDNEGGD